MAQTGKLTPAHLRNLDPPASGFVELYDAHCRGLTLRVFASGQARWTFRYRPRGGGTRPRIRLGDYPSVGLAEARRLADRHRGEVSSGRDPQGELRARRYQPTVSELIERYLADVASKKKRRTLELYAYYLRKLVSPRLGGKRADEVTPLDVDRLHRKLGRKTPVTANRTIVALSGVYAFAAKRRLVGEGVNPARGIEKFREHGRERFLSTEELTRLGHSLRVGETEGLPWPRPSGRATSKHDRKLENRKSLLAPHVAAALRLLLFTGCRLREILHLRWDEVDRERGFLLLSDSKTGRKVVVLNAPALQILHDLPRLGDFVILGDDPKKPRADLHRPWNLVRGHAGLADVRLHDLRHTHASVGAGAGLGLPIIGKLLGHKHPETTAKYAHLGDDPLRRASNRIGTAIADALGDVPPQPDNILGIGHR